MAAHDLETRVSNLEKAFSVYSQELTLALRYIQADAASSLTKSRIVLEKLLLQVYAAEMKREPRKPLLGDMLLDNQFTKKIERRILSRMNAIRDMANLGPHGEAVESTDAATVLDALCEVLDWYLLRYAGEPSDGPESGARVSPTVSPPVLTPVSKLAVVGTIQLNQKRFSQHYCAEYADVRFTISNLTDRQQKVPALSLRIHDRSQTNVLRIKKAGAMVQEFRLSARIDERDVLDLFADLESQEILDAKATDAFRLRLEAAEGMVYTCSLIAPFQDLVTGDSVEVASSQFEVEYPIRTVETLRRRQSP
jgi:hypothetical protein